MVFAWKENFPTLRLTCHSYPWISFAVFLPLKTTCPRRVLRNSWSSLIVNFYFYFSCRQFFWNTYQIVTTKLKWGTLPIHQHFIDFKIMPQIKQKCFRSLRQNKVDLCVTF